MKKVLFICAGNKYRSPMAEAFFNHLAQKKGLSVRATSAGLSVTAIAASEKATKLAMEHNADLSKHRPRQLDSSIIRSATLVLTMEESQASEIRISFPEFRDRVFSLRHFIGEQDDIPDPPADGHMAQVQYVEHLRSTIERLSDII